MKLVYQYMTIFFNFSLISSHLHPLQVENCESNSRLVVDEDDNGKVRLERVKALKYFFNTNLGKPYQSNSYGVCYGSTAIVKILLFQRSD